MEPRVSKYSKKNSKKGLKNKVLVLTVSGSILLGSTLTFAGTPILTGISTYLNGKTTDQITVVEADATGSAKAAVLRTALSDLKTTIDTDILAWGTTEKSRVQSEITAYSDLVQAEVTKVETQDLQAKKAEISSVANQMILDGETAIDAVVQEIFPAPTTTTTVQ